MLTPIPKGTTLLNMKTAQGITVSIEVVGEDFRGDLLCGVEVACYDYDDFRKLPAGLSYEGKIFGKTGWNSDHGRAYYKVGAKFATAI